MRNLKLGVEVVGARDLMPKAGQGMVSVFVELHFDDQKSQTTTKVQEVNPVWDENFCFIISDPNRLPNLTLQAYVYHHKNSNSKSLLGKVCLPGTSFLSYSDAVVLQYYPLQKRGITSRVQGQLGLKVSVTEDHPVPNSNQAEQQSTPSAATKSSINDGRSEALTDKDEDNPKHWLLNFLNFSGSSSRSSEVVEETRPYLGGGRVVRGQFFGDRLRASTYDLVQTIPPYLFVRVVKAQLDIPPNVVGSLDPYVEVKIGNYRGITRHFEREQNPEWNEVFAFARDDLKDSSPLDVVVKHKSRVQEEEFVIGSVQVDLHHQVTKHVSPNWYQIKNEDCGKKGELMLEVWEGTPADEAFPDAWHSNASLPADGSYAQGRSKVYHSPRLWYIRVDAIEAQDLVASDRSRIPGAYVKVQYGNQSLTTQIVESGGLNIKWNEELMFVAAEPFDDEYLIVSVEDHVGPDMDETLGRVSIALNSVERREDDRTISGKWFNFESCMSTDNEERDEIKLASRVHIRVCLEGGYRVLDEYPTYSSSDLPPRGKHKQLGKPIGVLDLGILDARGLLPINTTGERKSTTTDPYCVAKCGHIWVRTRTIIDSLMPKYNEQHAWEIYDPATILTVGVFHNSLIGNPNGKKDVEIGKVRIPISSLESGRVYTHYYPLLSLRPVGITKMGELQLAIRFSCTSLVNVMLKYSQPNLPKMHYILPLTDMQQRMLYDQAVLIVAARLGQAEAEAEAEAEPPLAKEVVEYMYSGANFHIWSMRRSKAIFFRVMAVASWLFVVGKWFGEVRMWKNPITTLLIHVLFLMLVCTPELILSTVSLYLFVTGIWNFRHRPTHPPHFDTRLSRTDCVSDELDEEFDTIPSSSSADIVRMRYDRIRSIAGRFQIIIGDIASQGERIHQLLHWRDPRATTIFIPFCLVAAIVLWFIPFKVLVILAGFYFLRHPALRGKTPSVAVNFFNRLPGRMDCVF